RGGPRDDPPRLPPSPPPGFHAAGEATVARFRTGCRKGRRAPSAISASHPSRASSPPPPPIHVGRGTPIGARPPAREPLPAAALRRARHAAAASRGAGRERRAHVDPSPRLSLDPPSTLNISGWKRRILEAKVE